MKYFLNLFEPIALASVHVGQPKKLKKRSCGGQAINCVTTCNDPVYKIFHRVPVSMLILYLLDPTRN